MFLEKPHLRFDGIYVSRNTYIRTGIVEWRVKNPVHLVCYYRYLRFFPQGEYVYRTTPMTLASIAPSMQHLPKYSTKANASGNAEPVLRGKFRLTVSAAPVAVSWPHVNVCDVRLLCQPRPGQHGKAGCSESIVF